MLSLDDARLELAPVLPENASFIAVPQLRVRSWKMENAALYSAPVTQLGDTAIAAQTRRFSASIEGTWADHASHQLLRDAALQASTIRVKFLSQSTVLIQGIGLVTDYEEAAARRKPIEFTAQLSVVRLV